MDVQRRHLLAALATLGGITVPAVARSQDTPKLEPWALPGPSTPLQWAAANAAGLSATTQPWLYLDFWASWCGPCRLSFPWMNQAQARWGAQRLRVVAVTVDRRREDAERFLKANPASFEIGFDPEGALARREAVRTMPTSLLVAPDGTVRHRHAGFTAASGAELDAVLQRWLGA